MRGRLDDDEEQKCGGRRRGREERSEEEEEAKPGDTLKRMHAGIEGRSILSWA
ncbi:hypothetical protein A2U01_0091055 [Trifolium medium]|uniref:Uncharacterized protein n=1 Tax=Trifolium medium TaxID=97028 RepID=A0A392U8T3_9FABA|nr:hypothetical protein [Trifolium medium]